MEALRKDFDRWYKQLRPVGRILFYVAIVGAIWLVAFLIMSLIGGILPTGNPWSIIFFVINLIIATIIGLVLAQFFLLRRMAKQQLEAQKRMITGGQRRGPRVQQPKITPRMARGGGRAQSSMQQVALTGAVSVDDIEAQYRANPIARGEKIDSWQEIDDAGVYVMEASGQKVEIIDASNTIGGYFLGKWEGGRLKTREIVTNSRGEPIHFTTLRNAKQYLVKGDKMKSKPKSKSKTRKKK